MPAEKNQLDLAEGDCITGTADPACTHPVKDEETRDREPARSGRGDFVARHGSTMLGQGLILGLGVITGVLQARVLGPTGRGEFAAITIWPMTIANVLCLGLNQAITFNLSRRLFNMSEIATATALIALVQSALCIGIYLPIAHFAFGGRSPEMRMLGVALVLFMPIYFLGGYSSNLFQGVHQLGKFNLLRITTPACLAVGLLFLFLRHDHDLRFAVSSQIAGYIVTLLVGGFLIVRDLRPRIQWNRRTIPSLIDYGYRTQATNLTNLFNQRFDQLALSVIVPPQQLGYYAVAVTLSTTVVVFPLAAGIVTFTRGSSQHSDDARDTIGESFRASFVWLLASCAALFLLTPFLIHLVFGPTFEGSVLACRILLPGSVMLGLNAVLYNGSSALGRPGLPSVAEGLSMIVTAIGLYLLVPRYGYIGAAIVSTVAYTFSFVVMLILGHRLLGLTLKTLLFGSRHATQAEL